LSTATEIDFALAEVVLTGRLERLAKYLKSDFERVIDRIECHDIGNLIYYSLLPHHNADLSLIEVLKPKALLSELWEFQHAKILTTLHNAFEKADISPLVFKGSALAYAHYPVPYVRYRSDSDILVAVNDFESAKAVLVELGFIAGKGNDVEQEFTIIDDMGQVHPIDLHGAINKAPMFSNHFPYEDLLARAVPLSINAKTLMRICDIDALLLACFHHHTSLSHYKHLAPLGELSSYGLIWIYDFHLLWTSLSHADRQVLARTASKAGLGRSTASGLAMAKQFFHTEIDASFITRLGDGGESSIDQYLSYGPTKRFLSRVAVQPSITKKSAFLWKAFFPSREDVYAHSQSAKLRWAPYLYVRRLVIAMAHHILRRSKF